MDPAPASKVKSVTQNRATLLDTSLSLFERYRLALRSIIIIIMFVSQLYSAMFALRNNGSKEAVDALVAGLHDSSALFRHEIGKIGWYSRCALSIRTRVCSWPDAERALDCRA